MILKLFFQTIKKKLKIKKNIFLHKLKLYLLGSHNNKIKMPLSLFKMKIYGNSFFKNADLNLYLKCTLVSILTSII